VHGFTTRRGARDFDLGLFSQGSPTSTVRENWSEIASATGMRSIVHARQVHGAQLHVLGLRAGSGGSGVVVGEAPGGASAQLPRLLDPADGHATDMPELLAAVTTADCVPVLLVDGTHRAVGAVHAGWRGVAAGILEAAFESMETAFGTRRSELRAHLGPAICGKCYEVGPEVFEALDQPAPAAPTPIDVRAVLAIRALTAGLRGAHVSISSHCTRCTDSDLYSHRAGDAQRQVGFIGIRGDIA
jgi:YfiH family protein